MSKFITNSFQVPNAFVDEKMADISGNACKLYLIIVRKTRGWQKESDRISYSQLRKFSGIKSDTTIQNAIKELAQEGIIKVKTGSTVAANEYELNDDYLGSTETVVLQKLEYPSTETVALGTTETVDTKATIKTTNKNKCANAQNLFEQFWTAYPNKKDKKKCEAKFKQINFSKHPFDKIMAALESFKQSQAWTKDNGQYIPMPTTWLNGERWNDELTPAVVITSTAANDSQPAPVRKHKIQFVDYLGAHS